MVSLINGIESIFDAISKSGYNSIELNMKMSRTCKKIYPDFGKQTALVYLTKGPRGYVINKFEIDKRTHNDLMKRKCYYDLADAEYWKVHSMDGRTTDKKKDTSWKTIQAYLNEKARQRDFISGLKALQPKKF